MADSTVDLRVHLVLHDGHHDVVSLKSPTTSTIRELKASLHEKLPSNPAPVHMRVIYLGKELVDTMTLRDTLGEIQPGQLYHIHMVLRDPHASRSSTAPPSNNFRTTPPFVGAPGAPEAASNRPQSQPPRVDRAPFPGMAPYPAPSALRAASGTGPSVVDQMNAMHRVVFHEMQQLQRNQNPQMPRDVTQPGDGMINDPSRAQAGTTSQQPQAPPGPGRITITRDGNGTDRQRWRIPINSGRGMIQQPAVPIHSRFHASLPPRLNAGRTETSALDFNRSSEHRHRSLENVRRQYVVASSMFAAPNVPREDVWSMPLEQFQRAIREIAHLNSDLELLSRSQITLPRRPPSPRHSEPDSLQADTDDMRESTGRFVRAITNHVTSRRREAQAMMHELGPSLGFGTSNVRMGSTPATTDPSDVFLLASGNGPQAVVYSPHGTFTTPGALHINEVAQNLAYQNALADIIRFMESAQVGTPGAQAPAPTAPQQPDAAAAADTQANRHAAAPGEEGPRGQQAPHGARNPAGAGVPPAGVLQQQRPEVMQVPMAAIATHFWLVLRIFSMLWFFSGSDWHRTLLLWLSGLVVYVFQSGILGDRMLSSLWDRVRRHLESLVGVAPHRPAAPPQNPPLGQNRADGDDDGAAAAATQPRRRWVRQMDPSPEATAQRLLQQHQQQRRQTWLWERLHTIERSLALFVASLWPGLGERMVAAREEAEAQARRDAQEREETERRAPTETEADEETRARPRAGDSDQTPVPTESEPAAAEVARPATAEPHGSSSGKAGDAVGAGEASSSTDANAGNSGRRDGWSFHDVD